MGSLFAPKQASTRPTNNGIVQQAIPNNNENALSYAQTMLQRSGGDARAAFYLAAKEKGIDPETILAKARSVKDPRAMVQNLIMQNPKAQGLMSLFSMMK